MVRDRQGQRVRHHPGPADRLAGAAVPEARIVDGVEEPAIDELVIKDPRLAWFLGLWKSAALRTDAQPSYVTMLRHVTEVVGSKQRYYAPGQTGSAFSEVQRTAAWVNMMLHTERATREGSGPSSGTTTC